MAASEITATEESQKFLHQSEGVSAPHRNHCGRGELEAFSVVLRKEGTSSPLLQVEPEPKQRVIGFGV